MPASSAGSHNPALAKHVMSQSNDDQGDKKKPPDSPPDAPPSGKSSGRVAFDSRGNPIWEWQLETGVYSRDVETQKLKKLDLGDLSIADSGIHRQPDGLTAKGSPDPSKLPGGAINPYDTGNRPRGGFNPYDNAERGGSNPYDNARAMGNRFKPEDPPPERRRTPADLRKLDAMIKAQRKKLKE
jgi:hypothetical protein